MCNGRHIDDVNVLVDDVSRMPFDMCYDAVWRIKKVECMFLPVGVFGDCDRGDFPGDV